MCNFFSLLSNGKGKIYYFDWEMRQKILAGKSEYISGDSHTSIADYYGFKGEKEDWLNKWEYNPLTKILTNDQINVRDDRTAVLKKCKALDWKKIIPALIIKSIINPLDLPKRKPTKKDIENLKKWISVRASVRASIGDSVWASVGASVWDSVSDSVRDSVWASVWDSVRASIWGSVSDSVWASVWDSVCGYASSFFSIEKWQGISVYPFQCCVDLWERGLVPSYDGTIWRLHSGKNAEKVWSGEIGEDK